MARKMSWREFGNFAYAMNQLVGRKQKDDRVAEAKELQLLENAYLEGQQKRRALEGPSPREKWTEEQRSGQVGSALGMFSELYKTASPASKKVLGEKLTSLWELMGPGDKAKYKMIVSHTPINPRVQKAMWFEETNPRPRMPIVREGDGSWTNHPPRTAEYRKVWAEFDIASDEWNILREMAMEDRKTAGKAAEWGKMNKHYQTDDPNVTAYRDPITRRIEYFNWSGADQAEIANAVEKKWATFKDMQTSGAVPLNAPKDYVYNRIPVTVRQVRELSNGQVKLDYKAAGPMEKMDMKAPSELTDAISCIDAGIKPSELSIKSPKVSGYYVQMKNIIDSRGEERFILQRELQQSIVSSYPEEQRYIPFVPKKMSTNWLQDFYKGLAINPYIGFVIPDPSEGKEGNVVLVRVDRLVSFTDRRGQQRTFWWDDINKIAFDNSGIPIVETQGRVPGDQLELDWSK